MKNLLFKSKTISGLSNIRLIDFAESAIRRYEPNELFSIFSDNGLTHQSFIWIYLDEIIHRAHAGL